MQALSTVATLPRATREAVRENIRLRCVKFDVMIRRLPISRFFNKYKFKDVALEIKTYSLKYTFICGAITANFLNLSTSASSSVLHVCSHAASHLELGALHISQLHQLAGGSLPRLSSFVVFLISSHHFFPPPLPLHLFTATSTPGSSTSKSLLFGNTRCVR